MKLAIHNWMREEPLETTIKRIAGLGYHYIEIKGEPEFYNTEEVKHLLDKYGIQCYGSVTVMLESRNLLSRDQRMRKDTIEYMKGIVKMVGDLEGQMVSIVPGTVGKVVPDGRPEEEWKWAVESLKEINEFAKDQNVELGIEPINRFETYFINRGDQALALAAEVGDNCGVCLDVFHMNIEEDDIYSALERARGQLVNVHVADNNRMAPGMGTLDWPRIVKTLKGIGYDRVLSAEFCSPVDRTPANPYPNSLDENKEGLDPLALKYVEDHGSASVTEEFYTMLTRKSSETLLPLISE